MIVNDQKVSVAARVGEHVKSVRLAGGVTQDALSARMTDAGFKWMQSTVNRTESGRRPLLLDEYVALCDILGLDPTITLSIARGPQIKHEVKVAEARAQLAAKQREIDTLRMRSAVAAEEADKLAAKLQHLEADAG